jgi:hypothetical protein
MSWWELKRCSVLSKSRTGTLLPNEKLDRFISFYTEYFSVLETTAKGPVIFAFNGADHVDVQNYLMSRLGPDMQIQGHDVYCVHIDSDDVAKWKTEKQLARSELRLEQARLERRQAILSLHERSPDLPVEAIAGIFGLSVNDVNASITIDA